MKKITLIVAAAALIIGGRSAQAQLILSGSTGTLDTEVTEPGGGESTETLDISYQVYEYTPGTYTYDYELDSSVVLSSFSLALFAQAVPSLNITDAGTDAIAAYVTADTLHINWDGPEDDQDISFTDALPPSFTSWGVDDSGGAWSNPPLIPSPSPVPEASTVMAGALMLLPLGIGAIRAIRKDRTA